MLIISRRFAAVLILLTALFHDPAAVHGQALTITTFAGQPGGSEDGTGSDARFFAPRGIAVDSSGNLYIADARNHTIRKMTATGVVTTLAGLAGARGSADGTDSVARFFGPNAVATDTIGNVYVADTYNETIRKISPGGAVTTLAGRALNAGSSDGTGETARFFNPSGIATDVDGNVYVADSVNETIRKITPAGVVTTLAGSPESGGSSDGTGSAARFSDPSGVATDRSGNVYVADTDNHTIRKITPDGTVTTLAGLARVPGTADGIGSAARFFVPQSVATDSSGNVYVAEFLHSIRKVTPEGVVTTLAGLPGEEGNADGMGSSARFSVPTGLATDRSGNVYVADSFNNTIRRITPTGRVTTMTARGTSGSDDGTGNAARFFMPTGVATDHEGNVYVADSGNSTIRKITPDGSVTTLAGQAREFGNNDGAGTSARFTFPAGVAVDSGGTVYVSDLNHTIRKITRAGVVSTFAGAAGMAGSADGTGSSARFRNPVGLATDSGGNVYVADVSNDTIRKITPSGTVSTLAGLAGNSGNTDGTGKAARFDIPSGLATDSDGNVYVADSSNHVIRKITPAGVVTTLAGSGSPGSADGAGTAAAFLFPTGVAVDRSGNIHVVDSGNETIRKITPAGLVTTVAGLLRIQGGSDGTGTAARFVGPQAIAVDSNGYLYIADSGNDAIRKGSPALPDVATIDEETGKVGATSLLDTTPQTAISWEWSIIRRPAGSTTTLSSTAVRNPTFIADAAGLYQFRLVARAVAGSSSITTVSLQATESQSEGPRRRGVRH